jgi:GPH family glycoside/pentoside/hexuronide:cation symporter
MSGIGVEAAGERPRIGLPTKIAYGFGSAAYGVKDSGFKSFLLLFYNQVVGLPAASVGLAILVAMLVDSLLDPIIGHVSDNWRGRWGRRHPMMYASALPAALSFLLLWNPPQGWSEPALLAWLVVVAVIARTCITVYEIPSAAMVAELTEDYDERTSILGYRYFFGWWGGLALAVAMFLIFLQPTERYPVGQLNRDGYVLYGYAGAILMAGSILASAWGTHRFIPWMRKAPPKAARGVLGEFRRMVEAVNNRSLLLMLGVGLFMAAAQGVVFALAFYWGVYFWGLNSREMVILIVDGFFAAAIALVVAPRVGRRFGKRVAACVLLVASIVVGFLPFLLRFAGMFPDNGSPWVVPILFVDGIFRTSFAIICTILVASMIADVVEDSELKTGRRNEGLFFAVMSLVQKAVSGAGALIASVLLAVVGFPQQADPATIDPAIVRNLALVYMPTVAGLYGVAIVFILSYRITRATHADNLAQLRARGEMLEEAIEPTIP